MILTVQYEVATNQFCIHVPNIAELGDWVGWQRRKGSGNIYAAPAYVSSVLAMKPSPTMDLRWSDRKSVV